MKLRCPRCQQKLSVPERLAGKGVRCPKCNRAFNVPAPKTAHEKLADQMDLDLESMVQLEQKSAQMDERDLKEVEQGIQRKQAVPKADPRLRTCPFCGKQTLAHDVYAEIACQHCWNPIPAVERGDIGDQEVARLSQRATAGFYADLAACVTYPIPALGSILTAAGLAFAAGLIPLAVISGLSYVMEQGTVGTAEGPGQADLSKLSLILMGIFAFELLFFSAVALHTFLDVIRATAVGTEQPPALVWDPGEWGKSLGAFAVLAIYLLGGFCLIFTLTVDDGLTALVSRKAVTTLLQSGGKAMVAGVIVLSLGVPMNLLGMGLGSVVQAIDPVRIVKAMGRTHAHYVFLFLLVCVYGVGFASAFWMIVHDWFVPQIEKMMAGSKEGDLTIVATGLLAWGVVMSCYFYGTYVMGRLHGLFARSFQRVLPFGAGR